MRLTDDVHPALVLGRSKGGRLGRDFAPVKATRFQIDCPQSHLLAVGQLMLQQGKTKPVSAFKSHADPAFMVGEAALCVIPLSASRYLDPDR